MRIVKVIKVKTKSNTMFHVIYADEFGQTKAKIVMNYKQARARGLVS